MDDDVARELLALYAQGKVKWAYTHYSRVRTREGYSGSEAARRILESQGVTDVTVEQVGGWLSDHYDPRTRTLRLSPGVYQGRSVAAVGIAAHEAGHALQHAFGYGMMSIRSAIVPVVTLGSWLAWPMIVLGMLLRSLELMQVGILAFTLLVAFQVITLPVEFNASRRARALLSSTGIVASEEEASGVSRVLSAAALTYVAATVTAVMQLLYFLMLFSGRRR